MYIHIHVHRFFKRCKLHTCTYTHVHVHTYKSCLYTYTKPSVHHLGLKEKEKKILKSKKGVYAVHYINHMTCHVTIIP